jgi:hypothetical protein
MNSPVSSASAQRLAANASLIVLVVANLVVGVLALRGQWGIFALIVLYWFEALVIGGFNILRLAVVGLFGEQPFGAALARWVGATFGARLLATVIGVGFFAFKFATFAFVVAISFLMASVHFRLQQSAELAPGETAWFGVAQIPVEPLIAILIGSHALSFVWNFLIRGEYRTQTVPALVFWPYLRMAAVSAVVAAGIALIAISPEAGRTQLAVVVFVLLKTLVDALSHRWEHRRAAD